MGRSLNHYHPHMTLVEWQRFEKCRGALLYGWSSRAMVSELSSVLKTVDGGTDGAAGGTAAWKAVLATEPFVVTGVLVGTPAVAGRSTLETCVGEQGRIGTAPG